VVSAHKIVTAEDTLQLKYFLTKICK